MFCDVRWAMAHANPAGSSFQDQTCKFGLCIITPTRSCFFIIIYILEFKGGANNLGRINRYRS